MTFHPHSVPGSCPGPLHVFMSEHLLHASTRRRGGHQIHQRIRPSVGSGGMSSVSAYACPSASTTNATVGTWAARGRHVTYWVPSASTVWVTYSTAASTPIAVA